MRCAAIVAHRKLHLSIMCAILFSGKPRIEAWIKLVNLTKVGAPFLYAMAALTKTF